jgi:phage host-nuclease inhibitor protein Gam
MAKKKKSPALTVLISSKEGLESALNRYVTASLDMAQQRAAHELEVAALESSFGEKTKPLGDEILSLETGIQLYCITHREELFTADRKSLEYANATIGFRLCPHAVDKIVSKDTFPRIAERLLDLPWGEPYVNVVYSLNKEELLKDRADLTDAQLKESGICYVQNENFFIDPKAASVATVTKTLESEAAA